MVDFLDFVDHRRDNLARKEEIELISRTEAEGVTHIADFWLFFVCVSPLPICAPSSLSLHFGPFLQVRRAMDYFVQSGKPLWGFTESSVDMTLLCLMGGCTRVCIYLSTCVVCLPVFPLCCSCRCLRHSLVVRF